MAAEAKLTKKQRKAVEFRNRGKDDDAEKSNAQNVDAAADDQAQAIDVVAPSHLDKGKAKSTVNANDDKSTLEVQPPAEKKTTESHSKPAASSSTSRKRKSTAENAIKSKPAAKKRFDEDGNIVTNEEESGKESQVTNSSAQAGEAENKRYILFVGNMSYKTTSSEIAKHFANHCTEEPNVRLLTTKADPQKLAALSKSKQKSIAKGKATGGKAARGAAEQSRGCAFVEFTSRDALQKALQFHHTALHGRTINVELTAGGGGRGTERKERIQKKNRDLEAERKKLHEKYVKTAAAAKKDAKGENEEKKDEPPKPHWGPNADKTAAKRSTTTKKIPKWAASGANAVRLNG